jgi:hypothetical protein
MSKRRGARTRKAQLMQAVRRPNAPGADPCLLCGFLAVLVRPAQKLGRSLRRCRPLGCSCGSSPHSETAVADLQVACCRSDRYVPASVMANLRLILITVCACHFDPGRSVSTLRRLRAQRPVESRSIKRLTVWLCHFPCTPPRPGVLMRLRFNSAAMAVIDMSSVANCSMMGRSDVANAIACSFALRLCSFSPPSFTPRAFALARPSFVRTLIIRRSFSANAA